LREKEEDLGGEIRKGRWRQKQKEAGKEKRERRC
jgi:hypothetical protein